MQDGEDEEHNRAAMQAAVDLVSRLGVSPRQHREGRLGEELRDFALPNGVFQRGGTSADHLVEAGVSLVSVAPTHSPFGAAVTVAKIRPNEDIYSLVSNRLIALSPSPLKNQHTPSTNQPKTQDLFCFRCRPLELHLIRQISARVAGAVPYRLLDEASWATQGCAPLFRSAITFSAHRALAAGIRRSTCSVRPPRRPST